MSGVRKSRSTLPSARACIQCQKRKSRCTGSKGITEACTYCVKAGKQCVFEAPPSRTSLTRKNLDNAEFRCEQLSSLLRSLNPGIDIDAALRELAGPRLRSRGGNGSHDAESHSPTPSDEYEWHEASLSPVPGVPKDEGNARDGMASLPTKTYESGYLGSSSGSDLIQTISSLLPQVGTSEIPESQDRQEQKRTSPKIAEQPANFMLLDQLASSAVLEGLIDTYFLFYNSSYPILHERTFRDRYKNRTQVHAKSSWNIIFYMVLAIGHWVSATGLEEGHSPYFSAARSRLTISMLESGTLGTVQVFLLMGNYLQKRDRPNTGYNLIGMAYRIALGLGLHREISTGRPKDTLARERRRQIFWTLYCFDGGFSITTGRPTTASDAFIDVRRPRNIDDSHCTLISILPSEVAHPTTYSAIIAQAQLVVIANKIYNDFLSAQSSNVVDHGEQVAGTMEQKLFDWKQNLPVYFTSVDVPQWFLGPRAIVLWKEQNLRIMLWRGAQRYPRIWPGKAEAGLRCQNSAIETIRDITTFCKLHTDIVHLGLSWYATYFLFQATLVLDVHLLERPSSSYLGGETDNSGDEALWTMTIAQARECLDILGKANKAATRCLAVLDRIHDHVATAQQGNQVQPAGAVLASQTFGLRSELPPTMLRPQAPFFPTSELYNGTPNSGTLAAEETTPDAAAMYGNHWQLAADPSLHMFLDDNTLVDNLFRGVEGFPSTMEQEYFDYVTGNLYGNAGMANGPALNEDAMQPGSQNWMGYNAG